MLFKMKGGDPQASNDYSQIVLGLDDQAPPGPDQASRGQGEVLGEGQLLGGASKVGYASNDQRPLHDRCPDRQAQTSRQQTIPHKD